jgi:ParB family transcriptional regulator, chromosome partitioning protein
MSRKNVLAPIAPTDGGRSTVRHAHVAAHIPAIGTIGRALGQARENTQRVGELQKDLERALSSSERVVNLDPAFIDPSPIRDRFEEPDSPEEARLAQSIAESGQRVPILVRPNLNVPGRYTAVFGHRRLAAVKTCGLKVRCIILDISQEEALVIQGQENNERKDTSFIEKAVYASRLKAAGMKGVKIAAALATSETAVSRMIAIPSAIPEEAIFAIGRAPEIGQPRWQALAMAFEKAPNAWVAVVAEETFSNLQSNERFQRMLNALTATLPSVEPAKPRVLVGRDGNPLGAIRRSSKGGLTLTVPSAGSPRSDGTTFTDWLENRLSALCDEWLDGR